MKHSKKFVLLLLFFLLRSFSLSSIAQDNPKLKKWEALDSTYRIAFKQSRYQDALDIAHSLVKVTENNTDTLYLKSLEKRADAFLKLSLYKEGIRDYVLLVEKTPEVYPANHLETARCLVELSVAYRDNGNITEANDALKKAQQIYIHLNETQSMEYVSLLGAQGIMASIQGDYRTAISLMEQSLHLCQQTSTTRNRSCLSSVMNLAAIYSDAGFYEKAEVLLEQARTMQLEWGGNLNEDYAQFLNSQAIVYYMLEQYDNAESIYLEAIEINKKIFGEEHPQTAITLNNLAVLYRQLEKYPEAEAIYLKIKEIDRKSLGENHPDYSTDLANLGNLYLALKKYDLSEQYFSQAAQIDKKIWGENSINYAHTLIGLSSAQTALQQLDKAELLLQKSSTILEKITYTKHPIYIENTTQWANLFYQKKEYNKALNYCQKAILLLCNDTLSSFPELSQLSQLSYSQYREVMGELTSLSKIYYAQQNFKAAFTVLQEAMEVQEQIRNTFEAERDQLRNLHKTAEMLEGAMQLGLRLDKSLYTAQLFRYTELNKAALLADAFKGRRAKTLGDLPDSLVLQEILLKQQLDELKKSEADLSTPEERNDFRISKNLLNEEIHLFQKMLQKDYPKYYALKYEQITANVTDVQTLLDNETLFLEYFVATDTTYLFVIDKQHAEVLVLPVSKTTLTSKTQQLRRALTNYTALFENPAESRERYTQTASWFFDNLLKSALQGHSGIKKLVVVADADLGHLPFEVFLTALPAADVSYAQMPYLLHQYAISYDYSATIWKENHQSVTRQNNGQLYALSASYSPSETAKNSHRTEQLKQLRAALQGLPAAQAEVEALSRRYLGNFSTGLDANEATFKKIAANYGVLHFAMHGILNKNNPMVSSLAFTENQDSLEDNFLEAWEISHLKLNADLVVLSACETGYGKFQRGEGILSLARSFMYAGVPALVVSLWEVNDASTATIMELFYDNLASGQNKALAMQQAKISYLSAAKGVAAHPAYWSPFVQMGNSNPIQLKTQGIGWWWWLLGGVGGAALLLLAVVKLRR